MICKKCGCSRIECLMTTHGDVCTDCSIWFAQEQMNRRKEDFDLFMTKGVDGQ